MLAVRCATAKCTDSEGELITLDECVATIREDVYMVFMVPCMLQEIVLVNSYQPTLSARLPEVMVRARLTKAIVPTTPKSNSSAVEFAHASP